MDLTVLIAIIVIGIITILNSIFLWRFQKKIRVEVEHFTNKLTDMHLDSKIADIFSENLDHENLHKLTNNLFNRIKEEFNLTSKNHSDLVEELRKANIDEELKETLIDFFQQMIIISYKEESMEHSDRDQIKKKLKMIIKMLNNK